MPKKTSTRSAVRKRRIVLREDKTANCDAECGVSSSAGDIPTDYAESARRLVLASWAAIVEGLIKKAMAGGYQQTKLLLDLSALTNFDVSQLDDRHNQQLCDALLEGLGFSSGQTADNIDEASGEPK